MRIEPASFRDNSGFVFYIEGDVYRAVSVLYKENYEHLINSGLYDYLVKENLLIPHTENGFDAGLEPVFYKIIKPSKIGFISYPYEWCFTQLKDAALTTLRIHKAALKRGMVLKDGSAYNIQFFNGAPVLIDTLSFDMYKENEPWTAYNQFCRHFLAPLASAALCDEHLICLLKDFLDGIPLDIARKIIGRKAFLIPGIFMHINMHSYFQVKYSGTEKSVNVNKKWMNKNSQMRLIEGLESIIDGLKLKRKKTGWSSYYSEHHTEIYLNDKKKIVAEFLDRIKPESTLDIGANEGEFSKIAAAKGSIVTALDSDYYCIDNLYQYVKQKNIRNIAPLVIDITNPSPSIGWMNSERKSFTERAGAGLVLALAVIHHLAISNNLPLNYISEFFSRICKWLIIEFVPKDDPLVKKLLLNRKDIFDNYNQEAFEKEFQKNFLLKESREVSGSKRKIFLMKKIEGQL